MSRFEQLRDRLPTLYRPEEGDASLLARYLLAVAGSLEAVNREASDVLQAHWFTYADRPLYSPYFLRSRQLQDPPQPPPDPRDPADRLALAQFPYIHDLARLASLLGLPPWLEPPAQRETVEEYRQRIERIVALYRDGLGTVGALRRMVEAQLPLDLAALPERRDRPFWLEEFAPLVARSLAVQARGEPTDMVGPLMRWTVTNDGLEPALPTIYVQGVAPQAGLTDATTNPLIELYQAGDDRPRLGIAYRGTIAPGQTLRLRPAYASWLGTENGVQRAAALPGRSTSADPTAPGPWQAVADAPAATVVAIYQSHDRVLWVAANSGGAGTLWRYDGQSWTAAVGGLPQLHCLAENGQDLLVGTESGLRRMPLYPAAGPGFAADPVPGLEDQAVHAVCRAADGQWWLGTGTGIFRLGAGGSAQPFALRQDQGTATPVYAVSQDRTGTLYFGTGLGLFQYQPDLDHWYWYTGEERAEQALDWQRFSPEEEGDARSFPSEAQVFLPSVRCVRRGPDASLWLGTERGIARYVAHAVRGLAYETVLEAFPDLTTGRVFDIKEDARGLVWFCTDRGLLRYDGRDWWQFQAGTWGQLGRADTLYDDTPEPRGAWRFHRASAQWQRYSPRTSAWVNAAAAPRTSAGAAVRTVAWTDGVVAELGQWDGAHFTNPTAADAAALLVRHKPNERRIATGGLPAVPRLPAGTSVWRYLALEPEGLAEPADRPAWTSEGRLLPPPANLEAPGEGRYDGEIPPPPSYYDEAVFAFHPAARIWLTWEARRPLTVLARLKQRSAGEHVDPAILDRVWQGIQQVRPAGVRTMLAVEEEIVRGRDDGSTG